MTKDGKLIRSRLSAIELDIGDLGRRAATNSSRLNAQGGMLNKLEREREEWATRGALEHLDQRIPVGLKSRLQDAEKRLTRLEGYQSILTELKLRVSQLEIAAPADGLDPIEASANASRSVHRAPSSNGWYWRKTHPGCWRPVWVCALMDTRPPYRSRLMWSYGPGSGEEWEVVVGELSTQWGPRCEGRPE